MKPPPFTYHAPGSVREAVDLLAEHGEDARILAGGQSLVPTMNFRLARPDHLIDINGVDELDYVEERDGWLRIGALARHAAFEMPVASGPLGTLLPGIARHIAHLPIRTRGTFCGSLAHADPASEWCLAAVTLDAEIVARNTGRERTIPASEFFDGPLTTALRADEILVEARLPLPDAGVRTGFAEFSRRAGDFALAMACATVTLEDGRIAEARLGIGGASETPTRVDEAELALRGMAPDAEAAGLAARLASGAIEPLEDIHGSAEYRRELAAAMARRALMAAFAS